MLNKSLNLGKSFARTYNKITNYKHHLIAKNPGPKDLALVCPLKGALHDSALLNIVMECWSNGVLEKRKPNPDLLQL
jgi:hypothetical protein